MINENGTPYGREFPLIRLPKKSKAFLAIQTKSATVLFPLIRLPKKSKASDDNDDDDDDDGFH